jgi:hypothetical protein
MLFRRRFFLAAALAAAVGLVGPPTARAAFTVTLQQTAGSPAVSGANPVTVADTAGSLSFPLPPAGTIFDTSTTEGHIVLGQSQGAFAFPSSAVTFGAFSLTFNGQRSSDEGGALVIGSTGPTITTVTNMSSTTATLVITLQEDAFALPAGPASLGVTNSLTVLGITGPTGNFSLSSTSTVQNNTSPFNPVTVGTSLSGGPGGTSNTVIFERNGGGSYTAIHTFTLTLDAGASVQFQGQTAVATPAPPGLILAATALPFAGLLRRRLRRKEAAVA